MLRTALAGRIPTLRETELEGPAGTAFPLDARLGIGGLPQSGTGQVALLTGAPAPVLLGQHFGPWVPVRLRPLLASENLLRRAQATGANVVFANAYPRGWPGPLPTRKQAAPPLAALAAGVLSLHEEALAAGDAVAAEIVNDGWQRYRPQFSFPSVTPFEAGVTLARIAAEADLTLFAHYHTDTIGHRGTMEEAVEALERVDRFLAGILETPTSRPLIVVGCSDHGNLEVVGEGHTINPALGFTLRGHRASDMQARWMAHLGQARALNHVAPLIQQALTGGC